MFEQLDYKMLNAPIWSQSMSSEANRVVLSIRLRPEDKKTFADETANCGLEASVAARQLLELIVKNMRAGNDYVEILHTVTRALNAGTKDPGSKNAA